MTTRLAAHAPPNQPAYVLGGTKPHCQYVRALLFLQTFTLCCSGAAQHPRRIGDFARAPLFVELQNERLAIGCGVCAGAGELSCALHCQARCAAPLRRAGAGDERATPCPALRACYEADIR